MREAEKRIGFGLTAAIIVVSFFPLVYVNGKFCNLIELFVGLDLKSGEYIAVTCIQSLIPAIYIDNLVTYIGKKKESVRTKIIAALGIGSFFVEILLIINMRMKEGGFFQNAPIISGWFLVRWVLMILEYVNRQYGERIYDWLIRRMRTMERVQRRKRKAERQLLYRILGKMLWKNRKNFLFLSLGGIALNSILFSTIAFKDLLQKVVADNQSGITVRYVVTTSFLMIYVLLLFLLFLSVICYMRSRSGEYGMLEVLGIQNRDRKRFIAVECVLFFVVSMIGGMIAGSLEAKVMIGCLESVYPQSSGQLSVMFSSVAATTIIEIIGAFLLFAVCDEVFACFGVTEVLNMGVSSGQVPQKHPILWKCGLVFCVTSVGMIQTYWGRASKAYPMVLAVLGIYFLYVSAGGLLVRLKNKQKRYYKVLLWINTWYHRFYYNITTMFIVTIFIFIMLFGYTLPLLDNMPVHTEGNYPYDIVWTAHREDEPFLEILEGKYDAEIVRQQGIRISTPDFGVHMGISESDYKKITNEEMDLTGKEIAIVYQREYGYWNSLGMDYGRKEPRLHIGIPEPNLWINTPSAGLIPSARFDTEYPVKTVKNKTITGVFCGPNDENIVVFSDEYYNQVKDEAKGSDLMVLINSSENHTEIAQEITAYTAENLYEREEIRVFNKALLTAEDKGQRLLNIAVYLVGLLLLISCAVFTTGVKIGMDSSEMEERYHFLRVMGMPEKTRRDHIVKECSVMAGGPVIPGIIAGVVLAGYELAMRKLPEKILDYYVKGMAGISIGIVFIYIVVLAVINRAMVNRGHEKMREDRDVDGFSEAKI